MTSPPLSALEATQNELQALVAGSRRWSTRYGPLFAHPTLPVFPECNLLHLERPPPRWPEDPGLGPVLDAHHIPHLRLLLSEGPAAPPLADSLLAQGFRRRDLWVLGRGLAPVEGGQDPGGVRPGGPEDAPEIDAILGEDLDEPLLKTLLALRRADLTAHLGLSWILARRPGTADWGATGSWGRWGHLGTLQWIRTSASARRLGLGAAVVGACLAALAEDSALAVSVLVDGDNPGALSLYAGLGFQTLGALEIWDGARSGVALGAEAG